jgi:kynureninase
LQTPRDQAWQLDEADDLAAFRRTFHIPAGTIYLEGNSLGLLSTNAEQAESWVRAKIIGAADTWR